MLYIAENIRSLRRKSGFTQEEVANWLNVSPQSVSKWERGDTYPDITLLPALANLFKTSIDGLVGMDRINDTAAKAAIFKAAHKHLRAGDLAEAANILEEAQKTFPHDTGLLSEHALVLALTADPTSLKRSIALCERVLSDDPSEKVRHTTRAALCLIHLKLGDQETARACAGNLPHVRESREMILARIQQGMDHQEIDAYLRLITLGEDEDQDAICIDFGMDMLPIATEQPLLERIRKIRETHGDAILPKIRVRDNAALPPRQVRLRHYAEYLVCKEFTDPNMAVDEVIRVLQQLVIKKASSGPSETVSHTN